jgi:hypothetical protein
MPITAGIGVISTIAYSNTDLERNFKRGVANDAWCDVATALDSRGYDLSPNGQLAAAVRTFSNNASVGLIVTVGGTISAESALQFASKPFVSLIGGTTSGFPGTIAANFYGGVTLDTATRNDIRFSNLIGSRHNFRPSEICLLSNPTGVIAPTETSQWSQHKDNRGRILKASNDAEIMQRFAEFRQDQTLRAMIVSADPFFQDHKDVLISEANNSSKHVCYPLQIYANNGGHHLPHGGRHTLHGPKLATAYFSLGQKAAAVIRGGTPSTLDTAPIEIKEG